MRLAIQNLLIFAVLASVAWPAQPAPDRAQELFAALSDAVVQVRVIDLASGDKSSIGSGFQVDASGLLATNFHVVSEYAHEADRFRLEYIDRQGNPHAVALADVDVAHDLALLQTATPLKTTIAITGDDLAQGERVFSMGNPLDLAMTIIEGTYNGFVTAARHRKILFSASLNPGMSGGPAVNTQGEVVGVNVARGGEQISFLVPAQFLGQMLERRNDAAWQAQDLRERIAGVLRHEQDAFFENILTSHWESQAFGEFRVPGRLSDSLKCWGGSSKDKSYRYEHVYQECGSQESIFIDQDFETGGFQYGFHRFNTSELNSVQFYSLLAENYRHEHDYNAGGKEEVSNYRCRENSLRVAELDWRVSFCARRYRHYAGLYDVSVVLVTSGLVNRGLVARLGIDGISEAGAIRLLHRFVEAIEWKP